MALRSPNFGNRWRTLFGTIIHRNLGGSPRFFTRAANLVIDGFDMTIGLVSRTDLDIFTTAFIAEAGTQVTYTDFEGNNWLGFWKPDLRIRRGRASCDDCDYLIDIKFEGSVVGGYTLLSEATYSGLTEAAYRALTA